MHAFTHACLLFATFASGVQVQFDYYVVEAQHALFPFSLVERQGRYAAVSHHFHGEETDVCRIWDAVDMAYRYVQQHQCVLCSIGAVYCSGIHPAFSLAEARVC